MATRDTEPNRTPTESANPSESAARTCETDPRCLLPAFEQAFLGLPELEWGTSPILYQIEGHCDAASGMAITNRNLALAMEELYPGRVCVLPTHGYDHFRVEALESETNPEFKALIERWLPHGGPQVCVRNTWPPRALGMSGNVNLIYFAWEETRIPDVWVTQFNICLDGVLAASRFVKKVLIDSGVTVPVKVVGGGLEHFSHVLDAVQEPAPRDGFTFLHVSSCYYRKGLDVLLKAFVRSFGGDPDVSLVVKTIDAGDNPWSHLDNTLGEMRKGEYDLSNVIIIRHEMTPEELVQLYKRCDAMVLPTRGEGFGLPMAEAHLAGMPLITTGYSGHTDFCSPDNTWLVDYSLQRSTSRFVQMDSLWAEPDVDHLADTMLEVSRQARNGSALLTSRIAEARKTAKSELLWSNVTGKVDRFARRVARRTPVSRPIRLAWVALGQPSCPGTRDFPSFIARFNPLKFEHALFTDDQSVESDKDLYVRCSLVEDSEQLVSDCVNTILAAGCDAAIVQHHPKSLQFSAAARLISSLDAAGVCVVLNVHSLGDAYPPDDSDSWQQIRAGLGKCDRILVQTIADVNRLKDMGLVENVTLMPPGIVERQSRRQERIRESLGLSGRYPIIGACGAIEAHQGLLELIEAVPDILSRYPEALVLAMNCAGEDRVSQAYAGQCRETIAEMGLDRSIVLFDEFLSTEYCLALLDSCDLCTIPAQEPDESHMAAASMALSCERPVIVSATDDLCDLIGSVEFFPGTSSKDLARGILGLASDPDLRRQCLQRRKSLLASRGWSRLASRMQNMIEALVKDRQHA